MATGTSTAPEVMRLFDAYVTVDWSAESRPKTGADSVWLCAVELRASGPTERVLLNPPTREEAVVALADLLSDQLARGKRVLLGLDFAFGFPAGFAARLGCASWRDVWKRLCAEVRDQPDNANNRFTAAAALNMAVSGAAMPFWGCPVGEAGPALAQTKPLALGDGTSFAEKRLSEARLKGPKSVFQLSYAGAVGGQTLVGIPRLWQLRHHPWLADSLRVWPFETGLDTPGADARIVAAEIYPAELDGTLPLKTVKDAVQVRRLAAALAELDSAGRLAARFRGADDLTPAQKTAVEGEEGWILSALPLAGEDAPAPAKEPPPPNALRPPLPRAPARPGGAAAPSGRTFAARPHPGLIRPPAGSPPPPVAPAPIAPSLGAPSLGVPGHDAQPTPEAGVSLDYLRVPAAIYAESFAIIRREADLSPVPADMEEMAIRLIHACGMTDIVADLAFSADAVRAGHAALRAGAPILVDAEMVAHGIIRRRLPAANAVVCTLGDPRTAPLAETLATTRSAAAVDLWREHLDGAVVAVGNAPTALFRLLQLLAEGAPKPAVILGFPVGFVGAAESKAALAALAPTPFLTLLGRRGGSAMAAAAVNALAGGLT